MDDGFDINTQLVASVWEDDIDGAKRLLDKGASVNAWDKRSHGLANATVLMRACSKQNKAMVNLLLNRGANINEANDMGMTALIFAIVRGTEEIVDLLLERGADVKTKDTYGMTVIHWAASVTHKTILDRLLCCCVVAVDSEDSNGHTALWYAASNYSISCVEVLLVYGANPDHRRKWYHETPLDVACKLVVAGDEIVSMMREALKYRSHQYVTHVISERDQKIHQLEVQAELRQKEHQMEITTLTSEIQQKDAQLKELLSTLGPVRIAMERAGHQPDVSISIDPDKVLRAVLDCGSDRWYCLAMEMGFSSSEVTTMTSEIPHNAGKLRAVFEGKRNGVGQRDAEAALLKACENITMPIIGAVLDKVGLVQ